MLAGEAANVAVQAQPGFGFGEVAGGTDGHTLAGERVSEEGEGADCAGGGVGTEDAGVGRVGTDGVGVHCVVVVLDAHLVLEGVGTDAGGAVGG